MQPDFSSLILMLLLIAAGFALVRSKIMCSAHIDALPVLLLNLAYPALIIRSVTLVDVRSLAMESVYVVAITAVVTLILFAFGIVALRNYKNTARKPLLLFSMAIGNIAYVALPVIKALFGDLGVYYTMLHSTTQDVIIWTLYYAYFVGGGSLRAVKPRKILSPGFAAIITAVVLAVFGIKPQGIAQAFLDMLAVTTVPLALVFIGAVLASYRSRKDWIPDRDTYLISFFKVLLLPAMVFGAMWFVPVGVELKIMMAVFFSAPATVMSTIWAKQFGFDYGFSVKALIFSTLLFLAVAVVLMVMYKPL